MATYKEFQEQQAQLEEKQNQVLDYARNLERVYGNGKKEVVVAYGVALDIGRFLQRKLMEYSKEPTNGQMRKNDEIRYKFQKSFDRMAAIEYKKNDNKSARKAISKLKSEIQDNYKNLDKYLNEVKKENLGLSASTTLRESSRNIVSSSIDSFKQDRFNIDQAEKSGKPSLNTSALKYDPRKAAENDPNRSLNQARARAALYKIRSSREDEKAIIQRVGTARDRSTEFSQNEVRKGIKSSPRYTYAQQVVQDIEKKVGFKIADQIFEKAELVAAQSSIRNDFLKNDILEGVRDHLLSGKKLNEIDTAEAVKSIFKSKYKDENDNIVTLQDAVRQNNKGNAR